MKDLFKLSDDELEKSFGVHVQNERLTLDHIYEHINEIFRRDLHLERGHGGMKEYLVKTWKYSERDAYRKIDGAKLLKEVPALAAEIKNGAINADKINEIVRAVKEKEQATGQKVSSLKKTELVAIISGKSVVDSQREIAKALDIKVKEFEVKRIQKDGSVRVGLSMPPELYANFMLCQEHASHKIQQKKLGHTLESALKILTDFYMAENNLNPDDSLNSDNAVTIENDRSEGEPTLLGNSAEKFGNAEVSKPTRINKTLTPKTRREVLARDNGCKYKDSKTGRVCGSKHFEQVDHKISQWAGGNHDPANLQVLCANHNRLKYRKEAQLRWL